MYINGFHGLHSTYLNLLVGIYTSLEKCKQIQSCRRADLRFVYIFIYIFMRVILSLLTSPHHKHNFHLFMSCTLKICSNLLFFVYFQDSVGQNSNDSSSGVGTGVGTAPGTPNSLAMRPTPSPTGSSGSRSMSPAVGKLYRHYVFV